MAFAACVALPLVVAAWLRWRQLGQLEPFVDEGANILTSLDPRVRSVFKPLEQGRPLLVWLFLPAGWMPGPVLFSARLMTSVAGLVTAGALGACLARLGGRRAALWGVWLWALLPLAVWHERLAIQDPFVTAALACALVLLVAGHAGGPKRGAFFWVGAGLLFGVAFLLKISAIFALPWLGLLYFALQRHFGLPVIDRRLAWLAAGAVVPVAALGSNLPLLGSRLGNYDVMPKFTEQEMAGGVMHRFGTWSSWYVGYDGWPLLVLLALALVLGGRLAQHRLTAWCAAGGWALSLLVGSAFYKSSYARYALPDHVPLVLFLGLALGGALSPARWKMVLAAGTLALARWSLVDWQIGSDPAQAPVPAADITQYVTGSWSGRGTAEVRRFLADFADHHQVQCLVLTHRMLRPGCYALILAAEDDPRIGVVPFTVYEPAELAATRASLRRAAVGRRVAFFLLYEGSLYPAHPWLDAPESGAKLVCTVDRGGGESFSLYQFEP
jgi:hypothetical protein